MKFLCDRCKTRYSIGDERVRGKILKIRCKNCANVITVREGMPDADAPGMAAERRGRQTTQAPPADVSLNATPGAGAEPNGARGNALGAAFASAMQKPPPALEEEWYVSIDGEQAGPFTLAEAQRWVANQPFDAELHCWSEGFDDWLPVDKVSHFRGQRKKPPAPPPPPPPGPLATPSPGMRTSGTAANRAITATRPRDEEEPKPLFAATMASLEKSASTAVPASIAASTSASASTPKRTMMGAPAPAMMHGHANGRSGGNLAIAPQPVPMPAPLKPLGRTSTSQGIALKPQAIAPGGGPVAGSGAALDARTFDQSDAAESATQIEPVGFLHDAPSAPIATPPSVPTPQPSTPSARQAFDDLLDHAPAPARPERPESEDDLDIGEVSRVVKLADIIRSPSKPANRTGAVPKLSGPGGSNPMLGRSTGNVPKLVGGTVPVALVDAVEVVPTTSPLSAPLDIPPVEAGPPPTSHRRGLIVLLIGAALLVGVMVVVFVMLFNARVVERNDNLGGTYRVNTERPDEPFIVKADPPPTPPNPLDPQNLPKPPKPRNPPTQIKQPPPVDPPPTGNSLKAEEIEQMAGKYAGTTTSCFRRADKGVDAILLSDVKKITVTLEVAPEGGVNRVTLSNNSSDKLGKCLSAMIRSWKFRASPGGTYRFVLAKPD